MCLYFLASLGLTTASENAILTSFEATYDLRGYGVLEVERSVTLLQEETNHYILRVTNKASGLAALVGYGPVIEESRFTMTSGQIKPLSYKNIDESGISGLDDTIIFDCDQKISNSKRKEKAFSIPITPEVLDPLTIVLRVRLDLKAGLRPTLYRVHETETIRTYHISYVGTEKINISNMEFDGIHLIVDAGRPNRRLHYWLAPALDYLPIQMQQIHKEKVEVRAILVSSSLLPSITN